MKDMEKRKRVMARSMQLGHCICDPKKPCPCDVFKVEDVCPCAGESRSLPAGPVRLTELVDRPGCASKIDEAMLKKVLAGLPTSDDPHVLLGMPAGDDAGVYRLDGDAAGDVALVQTVDVFSPSVDDPYTFGQIAAANSVSDVYAMGGRPITALSIIGFPIREVADDVMHQILRGGIDKMAEAGVAVIGGHSINDREIKAGFAVTGLIDCCKVTTNAGARPGDRLILTKPLGTGILAFAAQIDRAEPAWSAAAARWMATLNKSAAELMVEFQAHGCTDVTGFGLMGHLGRLAAASGVDVEIFWDDLPLLPGVLQCLADGIIPGATERNRESSGHCAVAGENVDPVMLDLCFDAQTSGGLLIAVDPAKADALLARLGESGLSEAAVIGSVVAAGSGRVTVRSRQLRPLPPRRANPAVPAVVALPRQAAPACCGPDGETSCCGPAKQADQEQEGEETSPMSCCEGNHPAPERPAASATTAGAGIGPVEAKFRDFMQAAGAPGALDARTKRAIGIALSVMAKCEPCVKSHVKKARDEGFTQEEIDEAAWMAISFGGSPAMMFYTRYGSK